jgi:hypothetical protein
VQFESELTIAEAISGHTATQPLKHKPQAVRSRFKRSIVSRGNPDCLGIVPCALRTKQAKLPPVGQSAIANHLLDVVDLVLTGTSLLAISQNNAEDLVTLARSTSGEGADQMRDCVVESGPSSRLVLSLAERRDLTERDPVMDCRNLVVE